jgi:hypothetical protein
MSEVSGVTGRRHFSAEDEEALRRDESTTSIVKRDTKTNVDIGGTDRTWSETKHHQQSPMDNKLGSIEVAISAVEGLEIAGVHLPFALAASVALPVAGFGFGLYALHEAHVKGDEQARAVATDNAHVALIGALELPSSYKEARLEGDYKHVAKGPNGSAFRATERLMEDKKGLATLQLHADRGMNAARDLARSGMSVEVFLATNPKVAESYKNDAAFHEGFDAYRHAKAKLPPDQMKSFENKLDERDGWYAQSQIQFRV